MGADIGYLLNKATRRFRLRLAEELASSGLSPQQAAALMAIARSTTEALTPSALASAIDADLATTSGLADRLNRDGWAIVKPNPEDGRSKLVELTDQARDALPSIMEAAQRVSGEITACLSSADIEALAGLLHRLCDSDSHTPSDEKAGAR